MLILFVLKPCIWSNFELLFKTPRKGKTPKRPFCNPSKISILAIFSTFSTQVAEPAASQAPEHKKLRLSSREVKLKINTNLIHHTCIVVLVVVVVADGDVDVVVDGDFDVDGVVDVVVLVRVRVVVVDVDVDVDVDGVVAVVVVVVVG